MTEPTRKLPVVVESEAFEEKLQLKIPSGFIVDEIPDPIDLKTEFGAYRANFSSKDGGLSYQRFLVLRNAIIPDGKYEEVRKFFAAIRDLEQSPVVFVRK